MRNVITNQLKTSVIITGASTTGKTTLARRLLVHFLVQPDPVHMTRQARDGEIENVDAIFITEKKFKENFRNNLYLQENIKDTFFNDVYYGCPSTWEHNTKRGIYSCFVSPTVKLAQNLKSRLGNKIVWIHLTTNEEIRKKRLLERNPEISKNDFGQRIQAGNRKIDTTGCDISIDTSYLKPWEIFFQSIIKIIQCAE